MSANTHGPADGSALQSGQAFTTILSDDRQDLSTRLEAAIDTAADLRTRFIRAGNPLRSPLTIERLLIQASGNDAESYYDRTADELTRIVAGPLADETRVILVVEQAETLDPDAVRVLREMTACSGGALPKLQVLFAGHTSFQALLDGRPAPTPQAAAAEAPRAEPASAPAPVTPPPVTPVPVMAAATTPAVNSATPATPTPAAAATPVSSEPPRVLPDPMPVLPAPKQPSRAGRVLLLLVVFAAVIGAVLWTSYPDQAAIVSSNVRELIGRLRGR